MPKLLWRWGQLGYKNSKKSWNWLSPRLGFFLFGHVLTSVIIGDKVYVLGWFSVKNIAVWAAETSFLQHVLCFTLHYFHKLLSRSRAESLSFKLIRTLRRWVLWRATSRSQHSCVLKAFKTAGFVSEWNTRLEWLGFSPGFCGRFSQCFRYFFGNI